MSKFYRFQKNDFACDVVQNKNETWSVTEQQPFNFVVLHYPLQAGESLRGYGVGVQWYSLRALEKHLIQSGFSFLGTGKEQPIERVKTYGR